MKSFIGLVSVSALASTALSATTPESINLDSPSSLAIQGSKNSTNNVPWYQRVVSLYFGSTDPEDIDFELRISQPEDSGRTDKSNSESSSSDSSTTDSWYKTASSSTLLLPEIISTHITPIQTSFTESQIRFSTVVTTVDSDFAKSQLGHQIIQNKEELLTDEKDASEKAAATGATSVVDYKPSFEHPTANADGSVISHASEPIVTEFNAPAQPQYHDPYNWYYDPSGYYGNDYYGMHSYNYYPGFDYNPSGHTWGSENGHPVAGQPDGRTSNEAANPNYHPGMSENSHEGHNSGLESHGEGNAKETNSNSQQNEHGFEKRSPPGCGSCGNSGPSYPYPAPYAQYPSYQPYPYQYPSYGASPVGVQNNFAYGGGYYGSPDYYQGYNYYPDQSGDSGTNRCWGCIRKMFCPWACARNSNNNDQPSYNPYAYYPPPYAAPQPAYSYQTQPQFYYIPASGNACVSGQSSVNEGGISQPADYAGAAQPFSYNPNSSNSAPVNPNDSPINQGAGNPGSNQGPDASNQGSTPYAGPQSFNPNTQGNGGSNPGKTGPLDHGDVNKLAAVPPLVESQRAVSKQHLIQPDENAKPQGATIQDAQSELLIQLLNQQKFQHEVHNRAVRHNGKFDGQSLEHHDRENFQDFIPRSSQEPASGQKLSPDAALSGKPRLNIFEPTLRYA